MLRWMISLLFLTAPTLTAAADDIYAAAVAHSARSAADRSRDERDHPAEILAFAGIKPGMVVADVFAGGGYYSELASYVVGERGKVLLVNNVPYDNYAGPELKARFADRQLANVERRTIETCNLRLAANSIDVLMIVMSYHDLYHVEPSGGWPEIDAAHFLDQLFAAIKPGGVFVIVDHAARPGSGSAAAQALHRIDEAFAKKDIAAHGFRFEESADWLRNPQDNLDMRVFDPSVRGKTDRFVHRYRKPKK